MFPHLAESYQGFLLLKTGRLICEFGPGCCCRAAQGAAVRWSLAVFVWLVRGCRHGAVGAAQGAARSAVWCAQWVSMAPAADSAFVWVVYFDLLALFSHFLRRFFQAGSGRFVCVGPHQGNPLRLLPLILHVPMNFNREPFQ